MLAVLNLVAGATDTVWLEWATKPLLLPLLAFWVWRKAPAEKGIIAALLFSAAGDIALLPEGELWFMAGMALFLCAHLCYITTFWRNGARPKPLAVLGYGAVLVGGLIWLWNGLGALAIPMTFYGLALAEHRDPVRQLRLAHRAGRRAFHALRPADRGRDRGGRRAARAGDLGHAHLCAGAIAPRDRLGAVPSAP